MKKPILLYLAALFLVAGTLPATAQQPDAPSTWTIVASYSIPGKASGLAWDGTYLYFGIYGANGQNVYQFNPSTGSNSLLL